MAASLLQLLRTRPLKAAPWGVLRGPVVASLSTRAEDPAKPAKKAKTASKTTEDPDERATLLGYKTPVAFPVRFSKPEGFTAQFAGAADQVPSFTAPAETVVAPDVATPTTTASNKSGDPDSGSSSSSDSDSDSDSEDEAENESSESPVKKEAKVQDITGQLNNKHHVSEAGASPAAAAVAAREAAQASVEPLGVSSEVLVDSAPEICAAVEYSPASKGSAEATSTSVLDAKVVTEPTTSRNAPADEPIETTQPALDVASAKDEAASTKVPAEICPPVDRSDELVVLTEAADDKLQAESAVEPPQEAAAVPPPEPEEPFDNSTYKNLQHHSYTPYTFVDHDVEMAKFRLPQPSSGRPSPRH